MLRTSPVRLLDEPCPKGRLQDAGYGQGRVLGVGNGKVTRLTGAFRSGLEYCCRPDYTRDESLFRRLGSKIWSRALPVVLAVYIATSA